MNLWEIQDTTTTHNPRERILSISLFNISSLWYSLVIIVTKFKISINIHQKEAIPLIGIKTVIDLKPFIQSVRNPLVLKS